jgi:hypothetical protein
MPNIRLRDIRLKGGEFWLWLIALGIGSGGFASSVSAVVFRRWPDPVALLSFVVGSLLLTFVFVRHLYKHKQE